VVAYSAVPDLVIAKLPGTTPSITGTGPDVTLSRSRSNRTAYNPPARSV
jgi:hypothetical protein